MSGVALVRSVPIVSGSYVDNQPKLQILELPDQTVIPGPVQVHQKMTNNAAVRQQLSLLSTNNNQAQVLYGNLISLPVGNGMLGGAVDQPEPRHVPVEGGQRDVRGDRLGQGEAQLTAVLG